MDHPNAVAIVLLASLSASCEPSRAGHDDASVRRVDAVFPVRINRPASLEGIGVDNGDGGLVTIRCANCHTVFRDVPLTLPARPDELRGPHVGMRFQHGALACNACHDPARYDALRLATGESMPMTDAIRLCRQCHGPQARDYDHGAHGGMRGHWDLSRGPRERNHCVDCHDPHAPAFGQFLPAPPPRDTVHAAGARHE